MGMRSNPPLLPSLFVKGNEMAWEWSHTQEAYDEAREILGTWERADLIGAIVEDESDVFMDRETNEGKSVEDYRLERFAYWNDSFFTEDVLAELAWTIAEKNHMCSNGGHELYVDRNGWYTIPLP